MNFLINETNKQYLLCLIINLSYKFLTFAIKFVDTYFPRIDYL